MGNHPDFHNLGAEEVREYNFSAEAEAGYVSEVVERLEYVLQHEDCTVERAEKLEAIRADARSRALPFATHAPDEFLREALWLRQGSLFQQVVWFQKSALAQITALAHDPECLLAVHHLAFQAPAEKLQHAMDLYQSRLWNWLRDLENAGALHKHAGKAVAAGNFDQSQLIVRDNVVTAGQDAAEHFAVPSSLIAVTHISTGDEPMEISDIGDWPEYAARG